MINHKVLLHSQNSLNIFEIHQENLAPLYSSTNDKCIGGHPIQKLKFAWSWHSNFFFSCMGVRPHPKFPHVSCVFFGWGKWEKNICMGIPMQILAFELDAPPNTFIVGWRITKEILKEHATWQKMQNRWKIMKKLQNPLTRFEFIP